jgi:TRAP-type C4-dicarboxylate transport system substrate-binding protein
MSFNGLTSEDKKEIAEQAAQAIAKKLNQYNKETMDTTQYFSEAIIEAIDSIEKGIKKGATEFTKEQFLKKHNIVYDENKHFSEEEK